ncbi:MAG TPA: hypothetical protein VFN30_00565 [Chitinophagaceae bacterium]|nr:hypothetical protein [Chitinophagaceae bacterium]
MEETLLVNDNGELYPSKTYPKVIRIIAALISYIFHPLLIIGVMAWYIIFQHPTAYLGADDRYKKWRLIIVCVNGIFFPLVAVLLLKAVGFVKSIFLPSQKERIIPYIITNFFFFWTFWIFRNTPETPAIMKGMTLGVFLASSLAILFNIYHKVSMHAIGVGGLLGLLLTSIYTEPSIISALPLTLALLITGFVCTSRLIASNHKPADIYIGFLMGLLCQFIGWWIMSA